MGGPRTEEGRIAEAQKMLDERAAIRRQKEAEKKAWWDRYYEQLGMANNNVGTGAKRSRKRRPVIVQLYR